MTKRVVLEKLKANPEIKLLLTNTGDSVLGEISSLAYERTWSIGLAAGSEYLRMSKYWRGFNYMGQILQELRAEFNKGKSDEEITNLVADEVNVPMSSLGASAWGAFWNNNE